MRYSAFASLLYYWAVLAKLRARIWSRKKKKQQNSKHRKNRRRRREKFLDSSLSREWLRRGTSFVRGSRVRRRRDTKQQSQSEKQKPRCYRRPAAYGTGIGRRKTSEIKRSRYRRRRVNGDLLGLNLVAEDISHWRHEGLCWRWTLICLPKHSWITFVVVCDNQLGSSMTRTWFRGTFQDKTISVCLPLSKMSTFVLVSKRNSLLRRRREFSRSWGKPFKIIRFYVAVWPWTKFLTKSTDHW